MDENVKIALERQNPWWFGKNFNTGIDRLPWYPLITKFMKTREVLLLLGARRTGKSTLVYQIIRNLLNNKISPEAILFINLDEPLFQSKSKDPAYRKNLRPLKSYSISTIILNSAPFREWYLKMIRI